MTDLEFSCTGAETDVVAAAPTMLLKLRISESSGTPIHAVALRCQLRIEPQRRRYDDAEAEALLDLFGDRTRWGQSLKPLQFAFISQVIPSFRDEIEVELPIPCSYDFEVAANKYFYALRTGEVPLLLLFSGTVFTSGPAGISVLPVPWHKETNYRLPVDVWRRTMQQHFPGTAWLRLREGTFDSLHRYRARQALVSWDEAIERLLKEAGQ
ncbi:MAG TPA: DUF6084 family protein [Jatrophihabitans sp.]|jgi:hypothetical protein